MSEAEHKPKKFIAYVTKNAITKGIQEVEVEECLSPGKVAAEGDFAGKFYYRKGEWFKTREEAVARAKQLIVAARKSLDKKRKKLDELEASLNPA